MTVKNTKKPSDTKKNLASNTEKASPKEKIQGIFTSINKNKDFYIACIGTSAGGIKAIEEFFSNCPDNIGIAYIIISHLDPKHISILPEIIQRSTTMPVVQIEDGIKVEPNCIYVIPPNNKLDIFHGALYLTELKNIQHHNLAINYFLKSLAQDQLDKAICIILSGMGTDGTLGLKAVKAEYGLCFVQNPETAQFNGMPCSAVSTNLADFILSPAKMPEALVNYVNKPLPEKAKQKGAIDLKSLKSLEKVFFLLRSSSGHDFSNYKENTINIFSNYHA